MDLCLLLFILALVSASDSLPTSKAPSGRPQIIKCRSPEMETFSCYWSIGDFSHLTAPGTIQLLYSKRQSEWKEWRECPDYITAGENSCYFNTSYASVWVPYCIKLVEGNQTYDDDYCFRVEDIVIPDPPVGLNWTMLNTSPLGNYADIQVSWKPPPSADVQNGWITLNYQLQYKEVNVTKWSVLEPNQAATFPVYALKICHDYEIRVRAQGLPEIYGEFSEVLYVSFGSMAVAPCEEEFQVPWPLVMAFGTLGLMVLLSLVLFSKQQKLKILILPPVPVPKIKGIDPELLKKGKLDEVNSILASHGSYMPQLYGDDSWVEFIELDIDEAEERTEGSDTDRLLGDDRLKSHGCLGVRDDDSGRASCCEPDIPETDFSASDTCDGTSDVDRSKKASDKEEDLLCLEQKDSGEKPASSLDKASTQLPSDDPAKDKQPKARVSVTGSAEMTSPPVQTQLSNQSSVANIDFYTLVSDITPGGSVVLSPGQKLKMGRAQSEGQKEPVAQCQPSFAMDSAYFCEWDVKKCVTVTPRPEAEPEVQEQSFPEGAYFDTESLTTRAVNPAMAAVEEEPERLEMPVADYTSIQVVQSPQGLVLNATAVPVPDKEFLVSCGYVSTDQLNKILP
ncbi:growth hormone receptor [Elgaria multicarinata webbii]|uniref:growth hormone receptor n=1 Tax=Elgaria multicarinata webbii TaxID=159646 RepID=UPI002FCD59D3